MSDGTTNPPGNPPPPPPPIRKMIVDTLRGLGKGIGLTPVIETVSNIKSDDPKHSKLSIGMQFGILALILLDLKMNHGANIKMLLEYIGLLS